MSLPATLRFTTLLVGLATGSQPIAVDAPAGTASVELRLDGATVGVDAEAPWDFRVDLGIALRPHRLEAVARDAGGHELGRVRQGIIGPPTTKSEGMPKAMRSPRWSSRSRTRLACPKPMIGGAS